MTTSLFKRIKANMEEIEITELELTPLETVGRRIHLEATCPNGHKHHRVWTEKFFISLEQKKKELLRDLEWCVEHEGNPQ